MRRDLIIGLLVSLCFHGGGLYGPRLWDVLFPPKKVQVAQTQTVEATFWTPPPLPEIPPDPTDANNEQQEQNIAAVAPPSLLDVPSDAQPNSFTEVMTPPPPPSMGKPDASLMTVPKGNYSAGPVKNNLGQIFDLKDLDQKPEQKGIPVKPGYPPELNRQGVTGSVDLMFVVDTNGDVQNAEALKSTNREFENPAIQAVLKWKFRPGRKGGKPVNTRMAITIEFNLDDENN